MNQLATQHIAPTGEQSFFARAFAWMAVGLAVTGGVAAAVGTNGVAMHALFSGIGRVVILVLAVLEIGLVFALVRLVRHMNLVEAAILFLVYAGLNGVVVSLIFAAYTTKSIFATFFVTAAMFGALAVWGYVTKRDLTGWGNFLFMALIGLVLGSFVNLIWLNAQLYWITTVAGILIFSAYTAYDVQKLKQYEPPPGSDGDVAKKDAIVGALALYLDFVNLFLYLLRIFGRKR
jgi:uncharacterized protein